MPMRRNYQRSTWGASTAKAALFLSLVVSLRSGAGSGWCQEPERAFRAGAAASNITPPLGLSIAGNMHDSTGSHIHDELFARCLALDNGETRLAIVLVDSCMVPRDILDSAKNLIRGKTGIPPENVLIAATHTHSAPAATPIFQSSPDPEYAEFLIRRVADGVQRAVNNLEPARIGWGAGSEPSQVFNRRWRKKAGTIPPDPFGNTGDKVQMNPPRASEDLLESAGPTDPEVSVVSVQSQEGRPIALLANYSLHYVGGVGSGHVSADYFGAFASRIEGLLGADHLDPPFVGMLSNGTSGNINNIDFKKPPEPRKPYEQIHLVARLVAEEAARAAKGIEYNSWVPLKARASEIELGARLPKPEEVEAARTVMAKVEGPQMRTLPEIYAKETVDLSAYPARVTVPLQALRLGDLGICAIPCEVFVEIGLELKARSPFKPTFTIELANGYYGYLPTEEHHRLGGYETWRAKSSFLEVGAAAKISAEVLRLLGDLKE
ncbi:MAG: hypothetical protein HUU16_09235 [Candidatus Omnitrophica bacterium]|nr:hypothetical protein [Candidatus Omnitrophota bacterium]